jgi:hypothetical protein
VAVTISKAKKSQEDTIKTQEVMMKRFTGVAVILFLLLTVRVHAQSACDYVLSFEDVSFSGTSIEDGYFFSGFSQYGYYLDICGVYSDTATTDSIYAELSDDTGVYWWVYGTMIWNQEMTRAYVQASYLDEVYSTYLDGTIRFSNGWYRISAKGGDNDSASYIDIYKRINGRWGVFDNAVASLSQGGRTKFKNLDGSKLSGLREKLQTNLGQQRRRLKGGDRN